MSEPRGFDPHGFLHRWERSDPPFHRALMQAMLLLWSAENPATPTKFYDVRPAADTAFGYVLKLRNWNALVYFTIDLPSGRPTLDEVLYSPDSRAI